MWIRKQFLGVLLVYCSAVHVLVRCHFLAMIWRKKCFWNEEAWGKIDSGLTWNIIEVFYHCIHQKPTAYRLSAESISVTCRSLSRGKCLISPFHILDDLYFQELVRHLPMSLLPKLLCSGRGEEKAHNLYLRKLVGMRKAGDAEKLRSVDKAQLWVGKTRDSAVFE